jgi:hypothetical protein
MSRTAVYLTATTFISFRCPRGAALGSLILLGNGKVKRKEKKREEKK